jgi:hypothetical protein
VADDGQPEFRIPIRRISRRLPLLYVDIFLNRYGGFPYGLTMLLSSIDVKSSIVPGIAEDLIRFGYPSLARRALPSDLGTTIFRTLQVRSLSVRTTTGSWLDLPAMSLAIMPRAQAVGAGGIIGVDVLGRYRRVCVEVGPPVYLTLAQG